MSDFFHEGELVAVLTTQPLDRLLDYRAPEGGCFAGAFVEVPLGPRKVPGVVWGPGGGSFEGAKLRPIARVRSAIPFEGASPAGRRASDCTQLSFSSI